MSEKTLLPAPTLSLWLQNARGPYLNFLRNLTPQILLASLAWVLASKLNFAKIDLSNFVPTSGFFAFLSLFTYAAYSNISIFLTEVFPGLMPWVRAEEGRLHSDGLSRLRIPKQLLMATLKERKLELALAAFTIVALQFVLAGVFVASIGAALSIIRSVHA